MKRTRAGKSIFGSTFGGGGDASNSGLPGAVPEGEVLASEDDQETAAPSRILPDRQVESTWAGLVEAGAVHTPPYNPAELVDRVERSDTLPAMIEAVAVNVSGHGTYLEPRFQTEDEDGNQIPPPKGSDQERINLERWLERANLRHGFEGVCERVDRDVETLGWGAMEILRNRLGKPEAVEHVQAWQIRYGKLSDPLLVAHPAIGPDGEIETVQRWQRFRLIVQVLPDQRVRYFKEVGDPRRVNYLTGETREPGQPAWAAPGGASLEASEILTREVYCPYSPYGVPRWIGASAAVTNGRKAGELIFTWFRDAPIGAKLIALAGGRFRDNPVKRFLDKVDDQGRGTLNAWAFYGLEADTAGGDLGSDSTKDAAPRMQVVELAAPPPEAMYSGDSSLIVQSSKSVRATFRLPPVYMGASEDYSRAAADTARAVGEEQVIDPIRRARWHRWFDSTLLPLLGIRFWRLRFAPSVTGDDVEAAGPLATLAEQGGASPNALIAFVNRLTKGKQPRIKEAWGNRPMAITLKLLELNRDPNEPLALPKVDPATTQVGPDGKPVLGPDGKPLPLPAPGSASTDGAVQDAGYSGIQITSLLEIQRAVADGWLPKSTAAATISQMFPKITPVEAKALVQDIEEGSSAPLALAGAAAGGNPPPNGGGPGGAPPKGKAPPFGGNGKGAGAVDQATAKKALEGLEVLRQLVQVRKMLEDDAVREFDPGSLSPRGSA